MRGTQVYSSGARSLYLFLIYLSTIATPASLPFPILGVIMLWEAQMASNMALRPSAFVFIPFSGITNGSNLYLATRRDNTAVNST